ncbi:nucleoside diphosphate kinase homolog 7-like isoform X2 [Antedon mediterranea]
MYDIKNRRLFLKRSKCDSLRYEDLYIGSMINIHSRQLTIVDYADEFTRKQLSQRKQRTLAMIKPDAIGKVGPIIDIIYQSKLLINQAKMISLSTSNAQAFYAEHKAKPFYDKLVRFMTSGPVVAMELMGEDAIQAWRQILGPTDSSVARSEAPGSIRAMFGTDNTQNACHGSDSPASGERETDFFFSKPHKNTAQLKNCTCCIIKPTAVKNGQAGEIMSAICDAGFKMSALEMFHLERANAEEFLEVYKGVVTEYMDMVSELCSGPSIVVEITGSTSMDPNTIPATFREFVGPSDPEIARHLRPKTLRARFGKNKVLNAVHCTDLSEDGMLETEYFFRILSS